MLMARQNLLQQKHRIEAAVKESQNPLSASCFANIFIWQDFFDFECQEIDQNLCVWASNETGTFLYLPPLGKMISPKAVEECFSLMGKMNNGSSVSRIENVPGCWIEHFDKERFSFFAKSPDYVYRKKDIAFLRGDAYKSQRWAYNHFVKNSRGRYLSYEPSMLEGCLILFKRWAKERGQRCDDPMYQQMLEDNQKVHERVLRYNRELDLIGRVVMVDGRVAGYSFGVALNQETFCILCEVTDLSVKGTAVFIFREFCRDQALESFSFINAMDDSGLENLKRVKLSFHPVELISNYVVSLNV